MRAASTPDSPAAAPPETRARIREPKPRCVRTHGDVTDLGPDPAISSETRDSSELRDRQTGRQAGRCGSGASCADYPSRVQVPSPVSSKESSRTEPPSAVKTALAREPHGALSLLGA